MTKLKIFIFFTPPNFADSKKNSNFARNFRFSECLFEFEEKKYY